MNLRDLLDELSKGEPPADPIEAARRAMRPRLRRRFYAAATAGAATADGVPVLLDGRPVRTPGRRLLAAPSPALAAALAAEWEAQEERIDPAQMPLNRLANTIIDGVAEAPAAVAAEIANYLSCDLILYRAEQPSRLVERQAAQWDPVLAWMRETYDARFILGAGVMHVDQPEEALARARALIPADAWRLGALHAVTTLTGSALLALALFKGRLEAEAVWEAANIDEDWNLEHWGEDALARQQRAFRAAEMQAAARMLALL